MADRVVTNLTEWFASVLPLPSYNDKIEVNWLKTTTKATPKLLKIQNIPYIFINIFT